MPDATTTAIAAATSGSNNPDVSTATVTVNSTIFPFALLFRPPPPPLLLHREHGKRYTVWQDDANDPSGYRLLKAVSERPLGEALDDIYNIANGLDEEESAPEFLNSVAKFVRDFGRM